jgi:glycerol-3-phosphate dehydrogenase
MVTDTSYHIPAAQTVNSTKIWVRHIDALLNSLSPGTNAACNKTMFQVKGLVRLVEKPAGFG